MAGFFFGFADTPVCVAKAIAIAVLIAGLLLPNMLLQIIGITLFGHSSMDRFFGYGLKTEEGFKYTHLGIIGKK